MKINKIYLRSLQILIFLVLIFLLFTNSSTAFSVIYALISVFLITYIWLDDEKFSTKIIFTTVFLLIMILQQVLNVSFVYSGNHTWTLFMIKKIFAVLIIFIPFFALYTRHIYKTQKQFSTTDSSALNFEMIKIMHRMSINISTGIKKSSSSLSTKNLNSIIQDIPRHSYTRYLNNGSLTHEYFDRCEESLNDENIYIVISSTGSPASEIISLFTNKTYNHVSLCFDEDLKTIVSYNGGENISPPGLNREEVVFFNKKDDASIMVYKLPVSKRQKQKLIEKIKEINDTGSAYNLIGLITKFSIRPNIMFCSQFVYEILKYANVEYFSSVSTKVKPTDFVENDYYRKLQFCYEIKFNELKQGLV